MMANDVSYSCKLKPDGKTTIVLNYTQKFNNLFERTVYEDSIFAA